MILVRGDETLSEVVVGAPGCSHGMSGLPPGKREVPCLSSWVTEGRGEGVMEILGEGGQASQEERRGGPRRKAGQASPGLRRLLKLRQEALVSPAGSWGAPALGPLARAVPQPLTAWGAVQTPFGPPSSG